MTTTKKIIKAVSDPFPPYQYYNRDGVLAGIDYQLVKQTFEAAGYQVEVILDDWGKVNQMLKNKEVDALFQVAPTPERLKQFYFSQPYRYAVTEIVTAMPELEITGYGDLLAKGFKLAAIEGYVYGDAVDALPEEIKVRYANAQEELLAVSRMEAALGVFDQGVRLLISESLNINNVREIKNLSFSRPIYVMFNDRELCAEFDIALEMFLRP